jgi:hypothetical protein
VVAKYKMSEIKDACMGMCQKEYVTELQTIKIIGSQ